MSTDLRGWAAHWAKTGHIRLDDPCYRCGRPMYPATGQRRDTTPSGRVPHGGLGLCRACYPHRHEIPDHGLTEPMGTQVVGIDGFNAGKDRP